MALYDYTFDPSGTQAGFQQPPQAPQQPPAPYQDPQAPQPQGYGGLDPRFVHAIRGWEGYNPRAYGDGRQTSIGYGTRAQYPGEVIDRDEAERRLSGELDKAGNLVDQRFPNLPADRRQALVSLTYNSGTKWMDSGLGAAVGKGDWETAGNRFNQYTNAGGQPQAHAGLVARRAGEWNFGNSDNTPAPLAYAATPNVPSTDPSAVASSDAQTAIQSAMRGQNKPMSDQSNQYAYAPNYDPNAGLFDRMRQGGPGALFGAPNGTFPGANGRPGYALGNKLQQAAIFGLAINNPGALSALPAIASREDKKVMQVGTDQDGNPMFKAVDNQGNVYPLNNASSGANGQPGTTVGGNSNMGDATTRQNAIDKGLHGDELLGNVSPYIANQVKMIDAGAIPYNYATLERTPQGRAINATLAAYNPSYTALDYEGRQKGMKDWSSNKNSDIIRRGEQAVLHGSELPANFTALNNGSIPGWNAVANNVMEQTGYDAPGKARMNIQAVSDEMAAFVRGNGGSDKEFENWKSQFPINGSPDQQRAAVGQLAKLWEDSMTSLSDKRKAMVGETQDKRMAPVYSDTMKAAVAKMKAYASGGSGASSSGLPTGVQSIKVLPQ